MFKTLIVTFIKILESLTLYYKIKSNIVITKILVQRYFSVDSNQCL